MTVRARGDLVQVEADDLAAALPELLEEVHDVLELEPARHRGAGVRAKLGVEAVDVEGDVHLLRQLLDDLAALVFPGAPLELLLLQIAVEKGRDAASVAADEHDLLVAVVADADLHELAHL